MRNIVLVMVLVIYSMAVQAIEWTSGDRMPVVVELFTSEGCSSCPPADAWLSGLKRQPEIFQDLIPLAFHVDYWDRLGWTDRFASVTHSERQRDYQRQGLLSQVYTPGFVVNSQEWRAWFSGRRDLPEPQAEASAGLLSISWPQARGILHYRYRPTAPRTAMNIHFAMLGMGLCNIVKAGENRGRELCHDFVVLSHDSAAMSVNEAGEFAGKLRLATAPQLGQTRSALAVWVSAPASSKIEQILAGFLPQ